MKLSTDLNNFNSIFRPFLIQKENAFQHEIISNMDKGLYSIEYTPSRGENKDLLTNLHYYDKGLVAWLSDSSIIKDNEIMKSTKLSNIWSHSEIPKADLHNEGEISFPRGKKPERLLERVIAMASNKNEYVLDFFIGSGTTCATALKMGRKFIGIEQLDYIDNLPALRLQNVIKGEQTGVSKDYNWQGGGSFVYAELLEYNQYFITKIQEAKTKETILAVWHEMEDKAFLSYQFNKDIFNQSLEAFKTATLEQMQHYLVEVLDKNQLYVNFTEIEDKTFNVSEEDKVLNYSFYNKK